MAGLNFPLYQVKAPCYYEEQTVSWLACWIHQAEMFKPMRTQISQPAKNKQSQNEQSREEISEMIAQLDTDERSSSDNLLEKEEAIREMMAEFK